MKEIAINDFKITHQIAINSLPTFEDFTLSDTDLKNELRKTRKKLGELQDTMYAHGKYAVLVCLQGMDTAGKDSLVREVFKDFNARGVVVHSFKVPTELEKKHNFIWRHYIALPARGKFGVFNRTHYENVLVTKVHPQYLLGENLPNVNSIEDVNKAFWDQRFKDINAFEKMISDNGMIIFKFFLHLSKEEQKNRLLRRLNKREKQWKFSPGDLHVRKLWDRYQECYEEVLNRTSKPHAPWYNIPADSKHVARLLVASILLEELKKYKDIKEPPLEPEVKQKIDEYKQQLENES